MPKVINLSRSEIKGYPNNSVIPFDANNSIWISIHEPVQEAHTKNVILDSIPKLEMRFWDIVIRVPGIGLGEYFYPPGENDAKEIIRFIRLYPDKNIITNCFAGKSRSSAICKFCEDVFRKKVNAFYIRR